MKRLNLYIIFLILSYTAFLNPENTAAGFSEDVNKQLRPPAGADLTQITLGADDSSTIILSPGKYEGLVVVKNKSLTIKGDPAAETVLSGELEQALILVSEGGRLVLEDVSFQASDKTEVGLYINNGSAQVTKCKAEGLGIKLFYVQNGTLSIDQCNFKQINAIPISALTQSEIKVTNSTFEDISECAIGIKEAKAVEVKDNNFKKTSGAVVLQQGNPIVKITDNVVSQTDSKDHAIWVEAGNEVIILNNKIFKVGSGILLRTKLVKNVIVSDNTIVDCAKGAVYVEGIGPEDTTSVNIKKNHIVNPGDYGILLTEAPKVRLTDNIIIAKDQTGIAVQNNSSVQMSGNIISGSENSVYIHKTAARENSISDDILIGDIHPDNLQHSSTESQKINLLFNVSGTKEKYEKLADAVSLSAKPEDFPAFKELSQSIDNLVKETQKLRAQTKSFSSITVSAKDSLGRICNIDFKIFDKDNKLVCQNYSNNPKATLTPGTYSIETSLTGDKRQEVTVEKGEDKKVIIEDESMVFLTRLTKDGQGIISQEIIPVGFRKKSIIQAILKDKNRAKNHVARRRGVTNTQLKGFIKTAFSALGEIDKKYKKAGDEQQVAMEKEGWQSEAFQNTVTELGMLINAVEWALDVIALGGDLDDAQTLIKMAGEETEFRMRLIRTAAEIENRLGKIANGAVVKALNETSNGKTKERNFYAAITLNSYGYTQGYKLLLKQLQTCSNNPQTQDAANALLSSNDPETIEAMRRLLKTFLDEKERVDNESGPKENYPSYDIQSAAQSAVLNLIAYGNKNDLAQIAKVPMKNSHLEALFPLVNNPQDILKVLIGGGYDISTAVRLQPALETRPATQQKELHDQLVDILVANYLHMPHTGFFIREYRYGRIIVDNAFKPKISFCRPSRIVADLVNEKNDRYFHKDLTWIPRPWAIDSIVKDFGNKKYFSAKYLDYLSHEELLKVLNTAGLTKDNTPYLNLYLNHHQTASKLFQVSHPFPRGTERRAFVLRHETTPTGVVSGLMDIKPSWQTDSKLRFEITLRFATVGEGGLAALMGGGDPTVNSFVGKTGEKLVSNVSLSRSGREITVKNLGVNDKGKLVFQADIGKNDLSEVTLHLDITLFEKTWPVDVALYASPFAKAARQ